MTKFNLTFVFIMIFSLLMGQETLDTSNLNAYIFGGDQKSNLATINLVPLSLLDIEPDPDNTVIFGANPTELEAGLPVMGDISGSPTDKSLWLNFTRRSEGSSLAKVMVSTNQPIPTGMEILLKKIGTSNGGNFIADLSNNPIELSEIPKEFISNLGNGYTLDGVNSGYNLEYTLNNNDGESLPPGFQVLYTIIDY